MQPAEPEALDRPWRKWASIIVLSVLGFSIAFGFLILPVVQGYGAGLDPFTAICRAVGIVPGSPAMRQPSGEAAAHPTTQVAWSTDLLRTLSRPGPAGAEVAQICTGCHGERGIATDPANPNLAGQSAVAIYKQLHDYRSGSRVHPGMTEIAKGLSDQQVRRIACRSIQPRRRSWTRTSCGWSSGATRPAAFRPAIPATARRRAGRSKRRPSRIRTAITWPTSSAPSGMGPGATTSTRACAASRRS